MDFSYRKADPRIDSALRELKREVAALLASHIEDRQLGEATVILDMSPGLAGDLRRGRVDRVSLDRLARTALRLGYQVRLDIRPPGLRSAQRFRTRDTAP